MYSLIAEWLLRNWFILGPSDTSLVKLGSNLHAMNKTRQTRHLHSDNALSFGTAVRYVLFGLVLLSTQITGLAHTHTGDLQAQADCQLCLKLNSTDDAIVTASYVFEDSTPMQQFELCGDSLFDVSQPAVKARAPPGYN